MATTIAALVGAAASAAAAGSQIYGAAHQNNRQQQQAADYTLYGLRQAENNANYIRALNTLAIQQSRGGTRDSMGSSVRYDPATNQWITELGDQPAAAQRASYDASVRRNTIDQRAAEAANAQAALTAARAEPLAESARMQVAGYRPMTGDRLGDLLRNQVVTNTNQTNQPLIDATLREFARTGANAGPVLANLQRQNADNVRNSIIQSTISGMTGVDDINQKRQGALIGNLTSLSGQTNPQFQFTPIDKQDPNAALAAVAADRAKTASSIPAASAYGANQAQNALQTGVMGAASNVPVDPANFQTSLIGNTGKVIGNTFSKGSPILDLIDQYTSNKPRPLGGGYDPYDYGGSPKANFGVNENPDQTWYAG